MSQIDLHTDEDPLQTNIMSYITGAQVFEAMIQELQGNPSAPTIRMTPEGAIETIDNTSALDQTEAYSLTDASQQVDLSPQYILNLVERYHLITPSQGNYGNRKVYAFTSEDIATMQDVAYLRSRGYIIGEIKDMVENKDRDKKRAKDLDEAMNIWLTTRNAQAWSQIVEIITDAALNEKEHTLLTMWLHGYSLSECASEANIEEKQAKESLRNLRGLVAERLLYLLLLGKQDNR